MSDYASWLAANDRYLAAALANLRERLERVAASRARDAQGSAADAVASVPAAAAPVTGVSDDRHASWLARKFDNAPQPAAAAGSPEAHDEEQAAPGEVSPQASMPFDTTPEPATDDAFVPALEQLAQRLDLSPFERDLLLLCIAMELDTRMPALCAQAQQDPSKPWPTFALAFLALDQPSWDALSPERPLRYWRLLDIYQPGPQPLISAALSADERIVNLAKGMNYLDDRLAPLLQPLAASSLPPSQQAVADFIIDTLRRVPQGDSLPAVQLVGVDSASKQAIAQAVAMTFGAQALRLSAELLPASTAEQETLIRLWQRESQLLPMALYVDAADTERGDAGMVPIKRLLSRSAGLAFIDTREPWSGMTTLSVDVAKPTAIEQRALWTRLLGNRAAGHPQQLAGHFDFGPGKIDQIAHAALGTAAPEALTQALWQGALARTRPALDSLAQRIEPKASWDELKLPEAEKDLLRQIADQVAQRTTVYDDWGFRDRMNRGLSITALFAGESGTGKTMAAEVIARELGLSLYRIDLSAVVSKYIGETEKNLRKLFDAAEEGGAILFFDEADALFGRRSEVKDSHDRYANIEVNYLLQRLESFRGLAILATNMKGALDSAFLRRIRFVVNFPFPGVAERKAIWSSVFPAKANVAALDLERLARLTLTGGSIQGIALNAAFLAAKSGAQISMATVLDAARAEFRKLDKPVNEADFRWLESAGGKS
jgi:hypothetical protein